MTRRRAPHIQIGLAITVYLTCISLLHRKRLFGTVRPVPGTVLRMPNQNGLRLATNGKNVTLLTQHITTRVELEA